MSDVDRIFFGVNYFRNVGATFHMDPYYPDKYVFHPSYRMRFDTGGGHAPEMVKQLVEHGWRATSLHNVNFVYYPVRKED